MDKVFTQAYRCTKCAYPVSECRCPKAAPVSKPAVLKTVQARAAVLAPKPVVSAVLPANVAELRERMRRGEVVPLTGPGSLQEALSAPAVKSYQSPARKALDVIAAEPMPIDDVREALDEVAPDGVRMGDRMMDSILEATQQRFGGF